MNDKRLYSIIIAPITTEKTVMLADSCKKIWFKVAKDATKLEIKKAVEKLFNVAIDSVATLHVKGKVKSFKQRLGKRPSWKKACVTLSKDSDDINVSEFK